MEEQLRRLIDYQGVLSAAATTADGLLVATAGLEGEDAELLAAAGSTMAKLLEHTEERAGSLAVGDGAIVLVMGDELMMVALTEETVQAEPLQAVMAEALVELAASIGATGEGA